MKEMRTINETNKMIAEFMGIEFDDDYGFGYEFDEHGNGVHVGELLYHKSWDWLMPVIAKCYDIGCEPNSNVIGDITCELLECDLPNTYKMVVQYVDYSKKK